MREEMARGLGAGHPLCRYGSSRLSFRGPVRELGDHFIAVVGGSETVGRHVEQPFTDLLEARLGSTVVNFGQFNGSIEVALHDTFIPNACRDAALTVVTLTGAANLSNRLYAVHPRRNDRFLKASPTLLSLYPEVDFTSIHFTRHLLTTLKAARPDRFGDVVSELRMAWIARMRTFLDRIGPKVALLWCPQDMEEQAFGPLGPDPLFVTRSMVQSLQSLVRRIVVVPISGEVGSMSFDQRTHEQVADALARDLPALLNGPVFGADMALRPSRTTAPGQPEPSEPRPLPGRATFETAVTTSEAQIGSPSLPLSETGGHRASAAQAALDRFCRTAADRTSQLGSSATLAG